MSTPAYISINTRVGGVEEWRGGVFYSKSGFKINAVYNTGYFRHGLVKLMNNGSAINRGVIKHFVCTLDKSTALEMER